MRKKLVCFLLVIFTFLMFLGSAKADTDCNVLQVKIDAYNTYTDKLNSLNCEDTSDMKTVGECNDYNLKKNIVISDLMKIQDEGYNCSSKTNTVNKIIKDNQGVCSKLLDDDFTNFVNKVMMVFYIIGPILLILFGSLDYTKAVVASNEGELKKAHQRFFKRILATALLFLSPVIINLILQFNLSDYYLSGNGYSCNYDFKVYTKKYTIKAVQKKKNSKGSNVSARNVINGNSVVFKQFDSQWSGETLLCGSDTIGSAGCALTSAAIQIVNSGAQTIEDINPSSLNRLLREKGYCSGSGIDWHGAEYVTNGKFGVITDTNLTGDLSSKAQQLASYLDQGYYPIIQVKNYPSESHYVAVVDVKDGNIMVVDPGYGDYVVENLSDKNFFITRTTSPTWVVLYGFIGG